MEEDSMEVIINGGMIFLFAFGVPQVVHEDNAKTVMQGLANSDLQASVLPEALLGSSKRMVGAVDRCLINTRRICQNVGA